MERSYVRETLHFPRPVSPLFATTVLPAIAQGFAAYAASAGAGADALDLRVVDGYVYAGFDAGARFAPMGGDLFEALAKWEHEAIPEVRALQTEAAVLARTSSPPARIAADLDRLQRNLERQHEIHYELAGGMQAAMEGVEALLADAGDPMPAATLARLLAPTDTLLRDIDAWVSELAAQVAGSARLSQLDAPALVATLEADAGPAGETFRRMWHHVAMRPGRLDVCAPTWGEDPTPLLRAMRAAGGADAGKAFEEATLAARALQAQTQAQTEARFPEALIPQVRAILDAMRRARSLFQTSNHLVGGMSSGLVRLAYLRAADRLVMEGALTARDDVCMFEADEVRAALRGEPLPQGVAQRRRQAMREGELREPPQTLGPAPPGLLADSRLAAFLGARASPGHAGEDATEAGPLRGLGASAGRASGPVRIVMREEDLDAVAPGDVLVVSSLEPAWTPAMVRAAAIVTEAGGMLCHAAVVARELARPAVVGVPGATRRLRPGERIVVDGDEGRIHRE